VFGGLLGLLIGFSPIIFFMLLFSWIRRSASKQEPVVTGSALEFSLGRRIQFLVRAVLGLLVAFTVLVVVMAISKGEGLYGALIPLSVLVAMLLARPMPVILDQNGIRQQRWLRSDREMPWSNVGSMARGPNTGTIYVRSKDGGSPIRFSALLVGQSRFEREVSAHVGRAVGLEYE
jgi:hypothetical protein